jgi:hypothetical protein
MIPISVSKVNKNKENQRGAIWGHCAKHHLPPFLNDVDWIARYDTLKAESKPGPIRKFAKSKTQKF